ncbi:RNA polymerase sigma factor [Sporosarcina beigongshangi]|uniref:RNA polymerase sigma factor n=1 Tax=Sporosarcina beigongshangi TaxID=2782538 RepID=UPI001939BF8F|nr:hypothetical protein [Sporosarcina beigongshangi]
MDETGDNQKVKGGDFIAFEEWMDNHHRNIERFAFQNGYTQEQAAQITEAVCKEIYNELENLDFRKCNIYKRVLEKIATLQQRAPLLDDIFSFGEDAELHSAIIDLEETYRVPLVLQVFHGLDNKQVAGFTDLPISEVEVRIRAARELLGKAINESSTERLEKRFELLGKSYARLPILFNVENVWKSMISVSDPIEKNRKKRGWAGWLIATALGLILMSLVGSTFFTGEDWELRSDRKYIEGLKKEFAERVAGKQKILGVSDELFNRMNFFRGAREHFNVLLMELEDKNQQGEKIDRQLAETWLLELTEVVKLPSEYADELFATPFVNDAEQSRLFVEAYLMSVDMMSYSLYELYSNADYNRLGKALETGTFDADTSEMQQQGYSKNTIEVVQAFTGQNIERLLPEHAVGHSEFVTELRAALHESAGIRLAQYEREPFIMNEKLLYSIDETTGFIEEMEETLIASMRNELMGYSMEGTMLNLLDAILQGKTIEEFKNNDGSISEVHRNAWRRLALLGTDSGVGAIMTKIVGEMEASGWKHSKFRDSLDNWKIHEAYSYASIGKLAQFGVQPIQVAYSEKVFALPNNHLNREVAGLYDEFSIAYDRTILRNVHPLFIVGLFYYANDKDDSVMMWHLTDPASRVSSLEESTAKEIALLDITDSIRFDPSLKMDDGHKVLAPIEFERNGKMYYNVWMTYAEDEVWQVESIIIEEGSL